MCMTERLLPLNSVNGTQTTEMTNTTTITYFIDGTDVSVNWTSIIENGNQSSVETFTHTEFYNQLYERNNISITNVTIITVNRTHSLVNTTITKVNGTDTTVDTQYSSNYNSTSKGQCLFPFKVLLTTGMREKGLTKWVDHYFKVDNITYDSCLEAEDNENESWCPWALNINGEPQGWETCTSQCPRTGKISFDTKPISNDCPTFQLFATVF